MLRAVFKFGRVSTKVFNWPIWSAPTHNNILPVNRGAIVEGPIWRDEFLRTES